MITAGFLNYFRTGSTHLISWFVFMTKQTRQLPMMSAMMSKVRMIVTATSDILRGCQICNMTCWRSKFSSNHKPNFKKFLHQENALKLLDSVCNVAQSTVLKRGLMTTCTCPWRHIFNFAHQWFLRFSRRPLLWLTTIQNFITLKNE